MRILCRTAAISDVNQVADEMLVNRYSLMFNNANLKHLPRQLSIDKNYLRTLIFQHSNLLHFVAVYLHHLHRPLSGMHWMRTSQNQKPAAFVAPMRAEAERVKLLKSKSKLKTTSETYYI